MNPLSEYDLAYFKAYGEPDIHEEMIKDQMRTETYMNAIMQHQSFIRGKVVIDVGCGTGILSIFCARAGAKRVYAVEASEIATPAEEIVEINNLSDTIIVLHGRLEDVHIDEKVDVIISEWMGYMLLYENMLESVITARDRWLKPAGLILPSHAVLYMAPITNPRKYSDSIDFWQNVYGIDMSCLMHSARMSAFEKPSVEIITGKNVLTWPCVVKYVDCYTVTVHELESVTSPFRLKSMMQAPLNGFAFWFEVGFNMPGTFNMKNDKQESDSSYKALANGSSRNKRTDPKEYLVLSTAPEDPPTHWHQTVVYNFKPVNLEQNQIIEGSVTLTQSKQSRRFLFIEVRYTTAERTVIKMAVMN